MARYQFKAIKIVLGRITTEIETLDARIESISFQETNSKRKKKIGSKVTTYQVQSNNGLT